MQLEFSATNVHRIANSCKHALLVVTIHFRDVDSWGIHWSLTPVITVSALPGDLKPIQLFLFGRKKTKVWAKQHFKLECYIWICISFVFHFHGIELLFDISSSWKCHHNQSHFDAISNCPYFGYNPIITIVTIKNTIYFDRQWSNRLKQPWASKAINAFIYNSLH